MMQSHGASMRGPSRAPELQVVVMALHNARVIGGLGCTLQPADLDPMSTTESPWGSKTAPGLALAAARHPCVAGRISLFIRWHSTCFGKSV